MKRSNTIFALMVIVLPFAAYGIYSVYENKVQTLPVYGGKQVVNGISTDHTIADFELFNQNKKRVTGKDLSGKITVVNFFFTRCPVICPKMIANLKLVQDAYMDDNIVLFHSISVDPENDRNEQLENYASRFGVNDSKWNLLTGDKRAIYALARNSFKVVATDGDGGPEDFIHSEKLVLIDSEKRIRGYYDGTSETETKKLIRDIKKLKNEN